MATASTPGCTIVVHTPQTRLSVGNGCLLVESPGRPITQIPPEHIAEIMVMGAWTLTSPVLALAARHAIPLGFFSHGGEYLGRFDSVPPETSATDGADAAFEALRHQWDLARDSKASLALSQRFVAGKIQNARALVASIRRRHPHNSDRSALGAATGELRNSLRRSTTADSLDQLRGIEGAATHSYFRALALCINADLRTTFPFERRSRRPPLDRFNALLSFLYALLLHDCANALRAEGLELRVGFLHAPFRQRPSLACDLMEELRPLLADRFAIALVNRRQLRAEHFDQDPTTGATLLNQEGRQVLLAARAIRMRETIRLNGDTPALSWSRLPAHQARQLSRALRAADPTTYIPFTPRL